MESWALIIGVDQYWKPGACLRGAVRDALRMREWLLDPAGGNVPREHLLLLLAPEPSRPPPPEVSYAEATRFGILQALKQLLERSGGRGRRLFFHFAGHGLSSRVNFSDEQALLPSDFHPDDTQRSLGLRSLLEYFQATGFEDQFFFIDACRDIPYQGEFRLGDIPRPRRVDVNLPPVQQFVFQATFPLARAAESRDASDERGAFTSVLLEGLRGKGRAKVWDPRALPGSNEYVVRVDRLFEFVQGELSRMRLPIGDARAPDLIQLPQLQSLRGGAAGSDPNPILARLVGRRFVQRLLIRVEPEEPPAEGQVLVLLPGFPYPVARKELAAPSVPFQLEARDYQVSVRAKGYALEPPFHYVELYDDEQAVRFLRQPAAQEQGDEPGGSSPLPEFDPLLLSFLGESASLSVRSKDPLALLEVANGAGEVLGLGVREVHVSRLSPGSYRLRVLSPAGVRFERVLPLSAGEDRVEEVDAPGPGVGVDDTWARVLEPTLKGPVRSPTDVASWLLLVVDARALLGPARERLAGGALLLTRFERPAGLLLPPERWASLADTRGEPGLALVVHGVTRDASRGPHWLRLHLSGSESSSLSFPLPMFVGGRTLLGLRFDGEGQLRMSLHFLTPWSGGDLELGLYQEARAQDFMARGRLDHALASVMPMLREEADLMPCLLAGYLLLRLGRGKELPAVIAGLRAWFEVRGQDSSDIQVLVAEGARVRGDSERAREAYLKALDLAPPIFVEAAERLLAAAEHLGLDHPHRPPLETLMRTRVAGLPWLVSTEDWTMNREALHLLLASAETQRPVLDTGLAAETAWNAPKPERLPRRIEVPSLEQPDAAPNDLSAQRWGVIAPEGDEGDALLHALEPLIRHREREQGAPVRRYRVPANMDADASVRWRDEVYRAEDVPQEERPKYLLLLGDPYQVSLELQHVLAHGAFVGRLHFAHPSGAPDLASHAAYGEKVLAFEKGATVGQAPDVLLYTAPDGSAATEWGHRLLMEPCREELEKRWRTKRPGMGLHVLSRERAGTEELLRVAGEARAGVMLSLAHGLGAPARGWGSVEEQRALQGALALAPGQVLSGDLLRDTPFLPGGMWFCLACFGAATPSKSMFHAWLSMLAQQGAQGTPLETVLKSLPKPGERPFLAALPQAALANPKGPLAVIGHSDLAWMFSFIDTEARARSRASRMLSVLDVLAKGSRAGVALDALMHFYRDVNDSLMADYQARQDALVYERPDPVDPRRHGYRWMLRNDLRGYLLLGDPAVRLPLEKAQS